MSIRDGWTAAEVRAAERPLLDAGEPLMARAAAGLAAETMRLPGGSGRVLVLAGSGSNGGDALLAGAILARLFMFTLLQTLNFYLILL